MSALREVQPLTDSGERRMADLVRLANDLAHKGRPPSWLVPLIGFLLALMFLWLGALTGAGFVAYMELGSTQMQLWQAMELRKVEIETHRHYGPGLPPEPRQEE